ncbi:DUF1653 domain-containing protein [Brevibacillus porteri]|uniref:DUF1653 domain-containing protein n=1 Tax=Brevibacillus porteri TaxID=2126350 RepID=UPI003D21FC56
MQGIYQHYKGGIYEVYGVAKHTETMEELVTYGSTERKQLWVRPLTMFNESVEHNGQQVPRFKKLPDPEPIHIDEKEEAEFIQDYLIKKGSSVISVEDIKLITAAQLAFLQSKGLVVDEE